MFSTLNFKLYFHIQKTNDPKLVIMAPKTSCDYFSMVIFVQNHIHGETFPLHIHSIVP